jgi:mannose-1-phosphate guanylyltransferase
MITPIIMAGGNGTRLWPLSRTAYPKQFLPLTNSLSMLQQTIQRLDGLDSDETIIITNEEHRFLVAEQLRSQQAQAKIILEPVGRNTAAAIALAAIQLLTKSHLEPPIMLVLAADHVIKDVQAFQKAVTCLIAPVKKGQFGTLGIVPTEPAIGYGYIKPKVHEGFGLKDKAILLVEEFVEKPDISTATKYMEQGYLWNSGMFMLRADRYLEVLQKYSPEVYGACIESMYDTQQDADFIRIDQKAFERSPDVSVDYAVMDPLAKTGEVVVAPLNAGWSDVGSWDALWDITDKDHQGNTLLGLDKHQAILKDTKNSFVYASNRLVATLGIDDLVIVDTPDALLVADRSQVQNVKEIVSVLKQHERIEYQQHREVFRPWGKYDSLDTGKRYQVKHITVNPGAKLSVQMHHHRAEHWIVVSGTAKVTNGDKTYLVSENESTYIPIGHLHALENPGVIPLEMIEVQSGSYLGEDDIVRFEDRYGRVD